MTSQQPSGVPQTEQKAAPAGPPYTKEQWASFTEEQWEAAAAATLRADIDRMDAVAAATATATSEDKFVIIDELLYTKAWLIGEDTQPRDAGTSSQT